jgi:hypothetical protein
VANHHGHALLEGEKALAGRAVRPRSETSSGRYFTLLDSLHESVIPRARDALRDSFSPFSPLIVTHLPARGFSNGEQRKATENRTTRESGDRRLSSSSACKRASDKATTRSRGILTRWFRGTGRRGRRGVDT